jgi:hypothetical protein
MKQSSKLIRYTVLFSCITFSSQLHAAQWIDLMDGTATYDGTTPLTLVDKHTYRPTSATAWVGTDVTLPDKATATIGASSVPNFSGNTYTKLTVAAAGKLTFYGADGVLEVITSLVKSAKGMFIIDDRTSGGLTISAFTANADAEVGNITINTFGTGTVLDLGVSLLPAGSAVPLTLNVDDSSIITLNTITSIPKLTGKGRIKLGTSLTTILSTEVSRLLGFKGELITASGGTTDISFTSDAFVWTLSEATDVSYAVIKLMKGTVRLPASTKIVF